MKGSMYGNATLEISDKLREQRATQEISKIDTMFGDGRIKMHYQKFREQASLILEADKKQEEEEDKKMIENLEERKHNVDDQRKLINNRKNSKVIAAELAAQVQR